MENAGQNKGLFNKPQCMQDLNEGREIAHKKYRHILNNRFNVLIHKRRYIAIGK